MASDREPDTERTAVKTFVPKYQKEEWKAQADALDMSQSEFVRTMVQAGRRGFDLEAPEPDPEPATPGGEGLETGVIRILEDEACSWDELVERLRGDFEDELEEVLERLQRENRVQYSGRQGGYTLVESDE